MTKNEACKILLKLTGLYNKTLTDTQTNLWLDELITLEFETSEKVLYELKVDKVNSQFMPTQPQFLALYKRYKNKDLKEQDYCYVCNNKGVDILRVKKVSGNEVYIYDYAMHCDICEKGKSEAINYNSLYSEPISKYFDVNELARVNRKNRVNSKIVKKNFKEFVSALMSTDKALKKF